MISKLTQFELSAHFKQIGFWVAALLISWMTFLITGQRGSQLLFANSSHAIAQTMLFIVPNIIFVVCVLASSTLLRDSQYKMESLIFATPIDKFHYLTSRYLGLVLATLTLMAIAILVMMITLLKLEPALVGPFQLSHYVINFFIFFVPAVLFSCSVVFATAMFSKSMIAVYVSGIAVYVLYMIGSVLGNSPLMATSSPLLNEGVGFAALLEPYGYIAYIGQSAYWTAEQKNTLMPSLSGDLLLNRILWLTVSVSLFVITYYKFNFRQPAPVKKAKNTVSESLKSTLINTYQAVDVKHDFHSFNVQIWLSKLHLEYASITRGFTFIVLLIITVVFCGAILVSNIFNGPISNGQPYYPLTALMLEMLEQPLSDIGMLVAIFYAVELFWTERNVNINGLIDTTPTRNFTFYLAKLTTVLAVAFTLITAAIVVAILFQLSQSYFDIQPSLYLFLYYYAGMPITMAALLTLFLQRFASTKSLGLLFGFGIFAANIVIKFALFEHPLVSFAYKPQFIFSDMTQSLYHLEALNWYNAYWLSFALVLSVFTVKMWQRGTSTMSQKFTRGSIIALVLSGSSLAISGGVVFYQTNVAHEFLSKEEQFDRQEQYERDYESFKSLALPTVISIDVAVDIYPSESKYRANGSYVYQNQTDKNIEQLLITFVSSGKLTQELQLKAATLVEYNDVYKQYIYQLNQPMMPGETRSLVFDMTIEHSAFVELDGEHYVTENGTYIELEDVMPQFGFDNRLTISDEEERITRGLSEEHFRAPTNADQKVSDDWINFETVVSTSANQQVVAVGHLEKTWTENGRNFYHYKTKDKVIQQLAYVSAEFNDVVKNHNDVAIKIYHHPKHNKDNELIYDALTQTMDYFNHHYIPYKSDEFTVAELPYFSSNQSFGSAQPGIYLGVENRFFNLDNEDAQHNPLLRGVSHEFAHQYWGGYLEPNYIGGYATLTETLCKYTELVMARKLYGKYAANVEVHLSIDRYLQMRSYNSQVENPLYAVGFEPFIYYSKGKQVMHAMLDLLGEEKINRALKGLLLSHGYPNKPTSLDLLDAFYSVAEPAQKPIIDDLFKRVVFHEFEIHDANTTQNAQGLYVTEVDVSTRKLVLNRDTNEEEYELINEELEIGLYSGYPDVDNGNVLTLSKIHFNQDRSTISLYSKEKPSYVQIDPNRYRIDRAMVNNVMELP